MGLKLEQIQYSANGTPVGESELLEIEIPQIMDEDFKTRLQEIQETYRTIRDRQTGHAFEIAIVNESQLKNGAILMPSTMFSSLTQNIGNAIELAAHGAAIPDARVYVAFPGNGKSDDLNRQDRRYLADKGRFTQDGEAVESILALARALEKEGIAVKSISANAEAGRFGLGIMAALPPNTVTSVYLNGLPGICPPPDGTYVTEMMRDGVEEQKKRREEDLKEKYKVNDRTIQEARSVLPRLYRRSIGYFFQLLPIYLRAMPNLRACIKGFSGHDNLQSIEDHATLQDTLTALKRQSGARVTFQFGKLSKLHRIDECKHFGQVVTEELRKVPNQCTLQLLIDPAGSLNFHTSSPSKRWAAERYALMITQPEKPS